MDIVVTIPRKEYRNIIKEDEEVSRLNNQAVQFWSLPRKPKDIKVGDRVYFIEKGHITCYHKFIGFIYDPVCEVTGRVWAGLNLLLECPFTPLKNPVPHKGFQGFRYVKERIE